MAIHTLVLLSDRFSCNCNSIQFLCNQELSFSSYCSVYKLVCLNVQQCEHLLDLPTFLFHVELHIGLLANNATAGTIGFVPVITIAVSNKCLNRSLTNLLILRADVGMRQTKYLTKAFICLYFIVLLFYCCIVYVQSIFYQIKNRVIISKISSKWNKENWVENSEESKL